MEFSIKGVSPDKQRTACAVVGVFESRKLSASAATIDRATRGFLNDVVRSGSMEGKLGATLMLHRVPHFGAARVLLVGLGREREFHDKQFREACRAATRRTARRPCSAATAARRATRSCRSTAARSSPRTSRCGWGSRT